jgi:two-component system, sensor histidine kinase PdtaS
LSSRAASRTASPGRTPARGSLASTSPARGYTRSVATLSMDRASRHLQLLTDTIAAVNSTLELDQVFARIASQVAAAMSTDACFVYLYDEGSDMLELRATHGTSFDDPAHRPRMAPGEGITGTAAELLQPVAIESQAHLDPRFRSFPNLPEDEYESILAVPVLARDKLAGALNVRTRASRVFAEDEIALLTAIASQVGQAIENAKLYERSRRRVAELEALADIGQTVSSSLYLDEALRGICERTQRALHADECALALSGDDGLRIGHRTGQLMADGELLELAARAPLQTEMAAVHPLVWKERVTGALVVLAARPRAWSREELSLLATVAHASAAAVENARTALRGLLAQEIHHRVKNNLQTVASLLRLQMGAAGDEQAAKALRESVNRILSIAAVHDLLTATRADDLDCAGLIGRLEAMLGQGLGDRAVGSQLQPVTLSGQQATALALVFCELFQNAVEHGQGAISVSLRRRGDEVELGVVDQGRGPAAGTRDGLGLRIARALVGEELGGRLELDGAGGGRAVVTFPAAS